ncbi:arf-GAP with coiled-coil, ANK repeat and PH domain-containing protein 1 [Latimeria chalumnae]|uniref:arf-GAP with coiled-coil, ANK repeat and PH domain-containing protein 1 n=1 Tax=Latimeria chalumnae TaxID=7897 RepID=UPI00313E2D74
MTVKLDFEECLKDSPRFRADIEKVELDVTELESRFEKLVKLCNGMLETGRQYCNNSKQFALGMQELSHYAKGDPMMEECLDKFSTCLTKMIESHMELLETTQKSFKQQIQNFIKEDIRKFKETKKEFDKSSENFESALHRNAQAPRNKQHEADEASSALLTAQKVFRSEALDYVLQINVIQSKKKTDTLQSVLSLMDSQTVFYHQGFEALKALEKYRKELADKLHQLVLNSAREKRDMEQKHTAIKQKDISFDDLMFECNKDAPNGIVMEGYLYKRASNAFKTWSRRWFSIQNNQLVYQKKLKDNLTVVVEDLRLCTVKPCPDNERRFCFEVVSPSKSCMLQADSDKHQQAWVQAVINSISSAFTESQEDMPASRLERAYSMTAGASTSPGFMKEGVDKKVLDQVQRIPGNAQCCDCNEPTPDWASINLGITLCIECSGIHRSLGVHFSKVRSLTLDSWEPELIKLMCELGNSTINQIYEARIEEMTIKKPHPGSSRPEKEAWIRAKYVEKKFIKKLPEAGSRLRRWTAQRSRGNAPEKAPRAEKPSKPALKPKPGTLPRQSGLNSLSTLSRNMDRSSGSFGSGKDLMEDAGECHEDDFRDLHPGALLFRSTAQQNLPVMADALAHGADVNWVNTAEENKTPLIQAVSANSLMACEFLLQNGANVNQADSHGRGPLHHATILGHTGLACLFLKRGANQSAADTDGKNPLSIAIDNADADIVTLLRLAKMREAEAALGQSGDETYQDIFRDFSLMASDNPEKLNRRSYDLKLSTL